MLLVVFFLDEFSADDRLIVALNALKQACLGLLKGSIVLIIRQILYVQIEQVSVLQLFHYKSIVFVEELII